MNLRNRSSLLVLLALFSCRILPLFGEGNVIFIHPDGTGLGHWNAARVFKAGPDGFLNWDKMDRLAAYRPHQKEWLSSTSHAGATVHAYGKKVHPDSYGMDQKTPLKAASGFPGSIMQEAMKKGIRTGIVNSGHIAEPGTGVFLASSETRGDKTGIAKTIVESGADVIFCGGEIYLLPEGIKGTHGKKGVRTDGVDMLEEARALGYTVIFHRAELMNLPADTVRVLGVFSAVNMYNDKNEATLKEAGLPPYDPVAPTFEEMTRKAIEILSHDPKKRFFLVAEEEGTDNFSNAMNADGMLQATVRADQAIGRAMNFIEENPDRPTLLLVGSDSDAGHPSVWAPWNADPNVPLQPLTLSGSMLDGQEGSGSKPFLSAPDATGKQHAFGIAWGYSIDMPGSAVTKAHGYQSEKLTSTVDNTGLYRLMYQVLFGEASSKF